MMPPLNYGHGGANTFGDRLVHPGTYAIRQTTLRSLVADLGGQLAQNGFKWIFVMNGHGAPTHNIAINEACDFVSDTFRVTMLHLTALFRADAAIQANGPKINAKYFSAAELSSFGMDVHAGLAKHRACLPSDPIWSVPTTKRSRAAGPSPEDRAKSRLPRLAGLFLSPAKATAAYGRAIEAWWIDGFTDLILRAVRGENMSPIRVFPTPFLPLWPCFSRRHSQTKPCSKRSSAEWLVQRRTRD